jgi:hypothetical protein
VRVRVCVCVCVCVCADGGHWWAQVCSDVSAWPGVASHTLTQHLGVCFFGAALHNQEKSLALGVIASSLPLLSSSSYHPLFLTLCTLSHRYPFYSSRVPQLRAENEELKAKIAELEA